MKLGDTELAEPTKVNGWARVVTVPGTMGCYRECELVMCSRGAFGEGRNAVTEGVAILQHGFLEAFYLLLWFGWNML